MRSTIPPITGDITKLDGKGLYMGLCAPCHAADGTGYAADHAPSLVNKTFLESATDEFLRKSIGAGRPGTSMAAYSKSRGGPLDDLGVAKIVTYLRAQGPAAKNLPAAATGNAAIGAPIYAQRCFVCHGDSKIRGEAPSLANAQFLGAATDSFIRYAIVAGRPGTKMEAFGDKLTPAEIDGVVAHVRGFAAGAAPVKLMLEPTGKEPLVINPRGKQPAFTLRADNCPPAAPGMDKRCDPSPRYVSVEQVGKAHIAKQRMVLIDARPPSDWMRSHITGAVSIPYHDVKRLDEMPKDTWIIAYCACPHHLSGIIVDELRKRGFSRAVVLDEGINEWHRRGLPMTVAEGVTTPLPEPAPHDHSGHSHSGHGH